MITPKDEEVGLIESVEEIFQETLNSLKKLHQEKLELIKRFREDNNIKELNKIRETLKERA
jgi:hypothetical protein